MHGLERVDTQVLPRCQLNQDKLVVAVYRVVSAQSFAVVAKASDRERYGGL